METLWEQIKSFFWNNFVVPFLPLLTFIPAVVTMFGLAFSSGPLIDAFVTMINNLSAYVASAPSSSWVSQVNRVTPLSEGMAMLASLMALKSSAMTIRFALKFVPFYG